MAKMNTKRLTLTEAHTFIQFGIQMPGCYNAARNK